MKRALATAAMFGATLATPPAGANGRYPATNQLVVAPADPREIVVRATYGVLLTRDGGQTWGWICEDAVGFRGPEDPAMGVFGDGVIAAGLFEGLSSSRDGGCSFRFDTSIGSRIVVDVSVVRSDTARGYAVTFASPAATSSELWSTEDNGAHWARKSTFPDGFAALTVDAALSDTQRVYATGASGEAGAFAASDDGGMSFHVTPIPGTSVTTRPYLSAVDPGDADVVWVRLSGDADALLVSRDGGLMFSTVFSGHGVLQAFALSPDGSDVLVGGPTAGLWRAASADAAFARVADFGPACLAWSGASILACGDEQKDGFSVGRSDDGGMTFAPLLHVDDVDGPLACAPTTDVARSCPSEWPATKCAITGAACATTGGGASAAAATPSSGGSGCSCQTPAQAPSRGSAWLLCACWALGARRRWRSLSIRHRS